MADVYDLDELHTALVRWVTDAIAHMQANLPNYVVQEVAQDWQLAPEGSYRYAPFPVYAWRLYGWSDRDAAEELQGLESYQALLRIAQETPPISAMFGNLVGTTMHRATFNFFLHVALRALPRAELVVLGGSYSIDELCDEVIRRVVATEIELTTVCYLQGISLGRDRLELEPGLVIERLTPDDVVAGLRYGLLVSQVVFNIPIFQLTDGSAFALKRRWQVPRTLGEPTAAQQKAYEAEPQALQSALDRLLESIALLSDQRVAPTGAATSFPAQDILTFGTGAMLTPFPAPRIVHSVFHLDDGMCTRLRELWARPADASPQGKALALAIRRLSFATQRDRWDDRLLDLFVAAEAFYLTDAGSAKDRNELKYRLALRAAVWSVGTVEDWTRRDVFGHMKLGYDMRSTIVHGGTPKAKDIRLKGKQVELNVFVEATAAILRAALHRALTQLAAGGRLSIPWDDLVLPADG